MYTKRESSIRWEVNDVALLWWAREHRTPRVAFDVLLPLLDRTQAACETYLSDYRIYLKTGQTKNNRQAVLFPKVDPFLRKIHTPGLCMQKTSSTGKKRLLGKY